MASSPRQKSASAKTREPGHDTPAPQPGGAAAASAAARAGHPALPGVREQAELFERAIAAFQARDFAAALPLFQRAAEGPGRDVAHSARLRIRMCQQRLSAGAAPRTPEEHYNFAVALINARKLAEAERHLCQALAQGPEADYLHYALALCRGLAGDLAAARDHLHRAIELNPANRVAARNDPDFAEIGHLPPLAELLYSGSTGD